MREYALVLLVTAAVTYLLVPFVRRFAIGVGAVPALRARDVHTEPTPRLGGLAMFGGMIAGLVLASRLTNLQDPFQTAGSRTLAGLLLAGGLLVVIGFIDDRWGLSAVSKLAGQVAAAGVLVWSGQALPWLPSPGGHEMVLEPNLSVTLTILLVVVTINAINFIDGMDGLAAGIVAVTAVGFLVYSYSLVTTLKIPSQSLPAVSSALLAGMCIGFLPHNFYPARIFMGDTGAMLLGLLLAYGPISSTGSLDDAVLVNYAQNHPFNRFGTFLPLLVPAAIFLIPYTDLMLAVIRRTRRRKPLMAADREHLHHRLMNIGHSYRQSVLIMWLWAALLSATVVALSLVRTHLWVLAVATFAAVLLLLPVTMPNLRPWRMFVRDAPAPSSVAPPSSAAASPAASSARSGASSGSGASAPRPGARERAADPDVPAAFTRHGAQPNRTESHRVDGVGPAGADGAQGWPAVPDRANDRDTEVGRATGWTTGADRANDWTAGADRGRIAPASAFAGAPVTDADGVPSGTADGIGAARADEFGGRSVAGFGDPSVDGFGRGSADGLGGRSVAGFGRGSADGLGGAAVGEFGGPAHDGPGLPHEPPGLSRDVQRGPNAKGAVYGGPPPGFEPVPAPPGLADPAGPASPWSDGRRGNGEYPFRQLPDEPGSGLRPFPGDADHSAPAGRVAPFTDPFPRAGRLPDAPLPQDTLQFPEVAELPGNAPPPGDGRMGDDTEQFPTTPYGDPR